MSELLTVSEGTERISTLCQLEDFCENAPFFTEGQDSLPKLLYLGSTGLSRWLMTEESAHNAGDLGGKDVPPPPEKRMAAHSGVCLRIPWTEGPGGLQSAG